ncbi:hypothetical protein MtrunA17_Chr6g0466601 [Medicago truncatula]|uniref:Uncharacterized protein n=1 Tax=Medicago truncatula TaxID=3880 RepID=G7ZYN2_MEDTR|nr:hypothetical protein MTR_6g039850 [Medicago truncatula]RHN51259.1 hypothetical protein MtrunA17_Chr6g0466601 [Medicago truncatula]
MSSTLCLISIQIPRCDSIFCDVSPSANSSTISSPVPVMNAPSPSLFAINSPTSSPHASFGSPAVAPAVTPSSVSTPPSQAPSPTISLSTGANSPVISSPIPVKSSPSPSSSTINSPRIPRYRSCYYSIVDLLRFRRN